MSEILFGELLDVDARAAWAHEALNFTPWLAENLDRLSAAVGIPLDLYGMEVSVGPYSADILAINPQDGTKVLIENQLTGSDHGHLGQILTYLSGLEAQTILWIAPSFREEHLSAIRWLNHNSAESFCFFAVRLRVVRIGDSPLAPLFEVLEKPNNWERRLQLTAARVTNESDMVKRRRAFWAHYESRHPELAKDRYAGVVAARWRELKEIGLVVSRYIGKDTVGIFVRGPSGQRMGGLEMLAEKREVLTDRLGAPPGNGGYSFTKTRALVDDCGVGWDEAVDWLAAETTRYEEVLREVVESE